MVFWHYITLSQKLKPSTGKIFLILIYILSIAHKTKSCLLSAMIKREQAKLSTSKIGFFYIPQYCIRISGLNSIINGLNSIINWSSHVIIHPDFHVLWVKSNFGLLNWNWNWVGWGGVSGPKLWNFTTLFFKWFIFLAVSPSFLSVCDW